MPNDTKDARHNVSACEQSTAPFIWPLGKSPDTPDEMNTSYGPRIDADRWDFHDGIDLPAAVGTPVHAMAKGTVHHIAGNNAKGFTVPGRRIKPGKDRVSVQRMSC